MFNPTHTHFRYGPCEIERQYERLDEPYGIIMLASEITAHVPMSTLTEQSTLFFEDHADWTRIDTYEEPACAYGDYAVTRGYVSLYAKRNERIKIAYYVESNSANVGGHHPKSNLFVTTERTESWTVDMQDGEDAGYDTAEYTYETGSGRYYDTIAEAEAWCRDFSASDQSVTLA